MDGFEGNTGIIVLAATNIPSVLDPALMRPGRFDRHIKVELPDHQGRCQILKVHSKNKKLADDVDLSEVSKLCLGMSGADLANVMNEAAILSARRGKDTTSIKEI
jgi:cell division protease FtsH